MPVLSQGMGLWFAPRQAWISFHMLLLLVVVAYYVRAFLLVKLQTPNQSILAGKIMLVLFWKRLVCMFLPRSSPSISPPSHRRHNGHCRQESERYLIDSLDCTALQAMPQIGTCRGLFHVALWNRTRHRVDDTDGLVGDKVGGQPARHFCEKLASSFLLLSCWRLVSLIVAVWWHRNLIRSSIDHRSIKPASKHSID